MAAVALSGDRVGLLPPGGRHRGCVQLRAVQLEMHNLGRRTGWGIWIGDSPGIRHSGVETALKTQLHGGQVEIQGPGVPVDVGDLHLHRGAANRKPGPDVDGQVPLLHLGRVLQTSGHKDLQHATSGSQVVLQRSPVDGDGASCSVGDGLVNPPRGVGQGKHGVVALSTAASAAGGNNLDAVSDPLTAGCQIQKALRLVKLQVVALCGDTGVNLIRINAFCIQLALCRASGRRLCTALCGRLCCLRRCLSRFSRSLRRLSSLHFGSQQGICFLRSFRCCLRSSRFCV